MGLIFVCIAAVLAAINNLLLRRSIQLGGSSQGYLAVQVMMSCVVMILLNPVRMHDFGCCPTALIAGILVGGLLGVFFWGLGRALETGPAGLSIAILNASSVVPALVLASLFGFSFGHDFTRIHAVGFLVLFCGILWAGWTSEPNHQRKQWLFFVGLMFALHAVFLTFLQWWAMVLNTNLPLNSLLPFHIASPHIHWFMPAIYFVAGLCQWVIFLSQHRRWPSQQETFYGLIGGVLGGTCSFFLISAPQIAAAWENAILFPLFTVGVLIFCNIWAQGIYAEKVNWKAATLCIIGLVIGTAAA